LFRKLKSLFKSKTNISNKIHNIDFNCDIEIILEMISTSEKININAIPKLAKKAKLIRTALSEENFSIPKEVSEFESKCTSLDMSIYDYLHQKNLISGFSGGARCAVNEFVETITGKNPLAIIKGSKEEQNVKNLLPKLKQQISTFTSEIEINLDKIVLKL